MGALSHAACATDDSNVQQAFTMSGLMRPAAWECRLRACGSCFFASACASHRRGETGLELDSTRGLFRSLGDDLSGHETVMIAVGAGAPDRRAARAFANAFVRRDNPLGLVTASLRFSF
jgi:hypothetical protein